MERGMDVAIAVRPAGCSRMLLVWAMLVVAVAFVGCQCSATIYGDGESGDTLLDGDDPWADVEVVKVLGAIYTVGDNTMLPGSVVAEVDPTEFVPYAFMKIDALR